MTQPILIAGGGIAGLATALALHQRGIACHVFERRPAVAAEGAGIQIGPNGTAILAQLGLRDALQQTVSTPDHICVCTNAGRELTRLPLGDWMTAQHGHPYWVVHRHDLMRALHDAVRSAGIPLQYGAEIRSTADGPAGVTVTLAGSSEPSTLTGAGLIGADGVWSAVRAAHFASAPPIATGKAAARNLLDAERVPADFRRRVTVWMAPDAHLVAYPVQQGRALNIVLIAKAEARAAHWSNDVSHGEIARRASDFGGSARELLGAASVEGSWQQWPLVTRAPLKSYAHGRIAVAGDAAHPMLPFLAQGAVMALEDAMWLARCVAASSGDVAQAFAAFSQARLARTERVVGAAARNGRIYHLRGALAVARNTALRLAPPAQIMRGYDWLYRPETPSMTSFKPMANVNA